MSYILEAIRRSEDERRKRLIPGVSTIHAARPVVAPRRSRLLYGLVAGGGLTLGVAGVIWLQTQSPEMAPAGGVADTAAVAAIGEGEREAGGGSTEVETAVVATPPRPEPLPARTRPAERDAGNGPGDGPGDGKPPSAKTAKPRSSRTPHSATTTPQPMVATKPPPRVPAAPPDASTSSGSAMGGGDGAAGTPLAELELSAPAQPEFVSAMALRDLPEQVRQSLPDIAISLHRYASSAEARQVRVNGRAVREGDAIVGDLSVAEITRGGVVFSIGDQRFYMSAFQSWRAKADR